MNARSASEASVFAEEEVVAAYAHRLPYAQEVYDVLLDLVVDCPRVVLDAGCGSGSLARGLVPRVDRVDAVDSSAAMVRAGKASPGGDHPGLRWICATLEEAELSPPYALAVAGSSLHWMDWAVVFPRLANAMTENGLLAIVSGGIPSGEEPWLKEEWELLGEYNSGINRRAPRSLLRALVEDGWFALRGQLETRRTVYRQSMDNYIRGCHSRGIYASRIGGARVAEFGRRLRAILEPHSQDGILRIGITETIVWGRPCSGPARV